MHRSALQRRTLQTKSTKLFLKKFQSHDVNSQCNCIQLRSSQEICFGRN
jgi:hypothetical protein